MAAQTLPTGHHLQPLPDSTTGLTVPQSNQVFTLTSSALSYKQTEPGTHSSHVHAWSPREGLKASRRNGPHKLRHLPRKVRSENPVVEDVYSADVAHRQVSHCYKKGVSETKNVQDLIIMHYENALNQFSLLPLLTPSFAMSQSPVWSVYVPAPPTLHCSEPFISSHLNPCSSQLWQPNGIRWGIITNRRCRGPTPDIQV